jgi:GTPase SAR1 family protein
MDQFSYLRDKVLEINQQVAALIQSAKTIIDTSSPAFESWRHSCDNISRQLLEHVLRIAVVGAIKSGKSTLVNALLHEDHLKRGAGVVTSIVTRIRQGDQLRARLFFKSWDEVNAEIKQALVLFPTDEWRGDRQGFDIRHARDRQDLKRALDALDRELRFVQDGLNANGVLLSSYIKGYDQVESYISTESTTREFDAEQFVQHRTFVASDALAVYLKDIQLDVSGNFLSRNIEVADCQGSDSPNPLHLAMIQDYLLKAHLIIYVISSRTGLRQADIRFLTMIKRMGIAGNMFFVCNCDFNEHDSVADFHALVQRIVEELAMIVENPRVFSISALFNLFDAIESELPSKDQERLAQWRKAEDFVEFSTQETQRLHKELDIKADARTLCPSATEPIGADRCERRRAAAMAAAQPRICCTGIPEKPGASSNGFILTRRHMHQVQSMIQNTLEGAVHKINRDMKKEVDRFFDYYSGPVLKKTIAFIREYHVSLDRYQQQLIPGVLAHALPGLSGNQTRPGQLHG